MRKHCLIFICKLQRDRGCSRCTTSSWFFTQISSSSSSSYHIISDHIIWISNVVVLDTEEAKETIHVIFSPSRNTLQAAAKVSPSEAAAVCADAWCRWSSFFEAIPEYFSFRSSCFICCSLHSRLQKAVSPLYI